MEPGKANHEKRGLFIASGLLGLLTTGLGLLIDLYVYALASTVDPRLHGSDYWRAVFRGMFVSGAFVPTLIGLSLVVLGTWVAISSAGGALLIVQRPIIASWRVFFTCMLSLLGIGVIFLLLL
jgi:hypothetical protein